MTFSLTIDTPCPKITPPLTHVVQAKFGGSVQKGTYVQALCLRNPQLPLPQECPLPLGQGNPLTLYCKIRTPCGLELS